jgi:anaerobic selenocysteine-containing dehydrogenase
MTTEITHRICSFCEATCGLELEIDRETRTLVSVRGNKDDVFSSGYLCPKAVAIKDLDEDPDRLRQPLVRRGGNLEPATWDEAFAEIKRRIKPILEEHGGGGIAVYIGNPTAHKPSLSLASGALVRALGTPHMYSASTLDQMPRHVSAGLLFGSWTSIPVPDIDRTDLIVIVGGNPMVSNGSMWTVPNFRGRHLAMKKRGGRMIVVDPKKTQSARAADKHLTIRPGTDVFFFFSILATLFDEDLVAPRHLESYLSNVDLLKEAVSQYSPEATAEATGLDPQDVRQLARDLSNTERAVLYARIGTSVTEFGSSANWAVDAINALCGNLDVPGGAMWPKAPAFQYNSGPGREVSGEGKGVRSGRRKSRVRGAPEIMGEFPAVCLAEEIETPGKGQIRALFTTAGNPALSAPGGDRLARALGTLDFMVSTDIYLNETTRHADVILPGQAQLEDFHFPIPFQAMSVRNNARFSPAVFEIEEGRPEEWEIMYKLALIISGQDETTSIEDYDIMVITNQVNAALKTHPQLEGMTTEDIMSALELRKGPERQVDLGLRTGPYGDFFGAVPDGLSLQKLIDNPNGIDLGPLEPRLPGVLSTPGGKIDLMPQAIAGDLPRIRSGLTRMGSEAGDDTRLLMVGRRNTRTNNSWLHNLPVLAKGKFKGALEISPVDAKVRGLVSGDVARVENKSGAVEVEVDVTDAMSPGTVSLPHGFGHAMPDTNMSVAAKNPGVNSNLLASTEAVDPLSGTAILNAIPVEVSAV